MTTYSITNFQDVNLGLFQFLTREAKAEAEERDNPNGDPAISTLIENLNTLICQQQGTVSTTVDYSTPDYNQLSTEQIQSYHEVWNKKFKEYRKLCQFNHQTLL